MVPYSRLHADFLSGHVPCMSVIRLQTTQAAGVPAMRGAPSSRQGISPSNTIISTSAAHLHPPDGRAQRRTWAAQKSLAGMFLQKDEKCRSLRQCANCDGQTAGELYTCQFAPDRGVSGALGLSNEAGVAGPGLL